MSKNPDLFLIGAPKAGTTAVADYLAQHPDIYCKEKEPRFFDASIYYDVMSDAPYAKIEDYLDIFSNCESQTSRYRLDASVFILYDLDAIMRILEMSPDARFIVVVRDPIEASRSMYTQRMKYVDPKLREVSNNFEDCWNLLPLRREGSGFPKGCRNRNLFRYDFLYHYEWHLPKLFELIPPDRRLILFQDEMYSDKQVIFNRLSDFLNLEFDATLKMDSVNRSYIVKKTWLNLARERFLIEAARRSKKLRNSVPFLNKLSRLLGQTITPKKMDWENNVHISEELRIKMKEEFAPTYSFLHELKAEQSISGYASF